MRAMRWVVLALVGMVGLTRADEPATAPLRPADSDAPLAKDWPDATRPGVIEVKRYPGYRSAVARARGAMLGSDNVLFFPLFNHISRRGVEMTTPVVSTYAAGVIETPGKSGDVSMEFVYRRPDLGEAGPGVGAVKVEDHPAQTYVCLGLQGEMTEDVFRTGVARLQGWLNEHRSEWTQDGPIRRLGYHGPMTPAAERRWEAQIPIRPADKPKQ